MSLTKSRILTNVFNNSRKISSIKSQCLISSRILHLPRLFERSYNQFRSPQLQCRNGLHANLKPTWSTSIATFHTKGDRELVEFLEEEIKSETKARKYTKIPTIEGFEIKTDGAEVVMTKQFNNENITVRMNINHSIDAEESQEQLSADQDKEPSTEMKSKPNFTVEIEKKNKTLAFNCSFTNGSTVDDPSQDSYNDVYHITEFTICDKVWEDGVYTVDGDIMDGYLYDLLMNMMEDRGVGNEFATKLIEFCSAYDHNMYIKLLQGMKNFILEK